MSGGLQSHLWQILVCHSFWHSFWHIFLTFLLADPPDSLSGKPPDILSGIFFDTLSGISPAILFDVLSDISFWHSFWHISWRSFWHIFWHSENISRQCLSDTLSDILSDISLWHSFWNIFLTVCLTYLCDIPSDISFWHSSRWVKSMWEHRPRRIAVGVRQRKLEAWDRSWRGGRRRRRTRMRRGWGGWRDGLTKKSNNPYLTGLGENDMRIERLSALEWLCKDPSLLKMMTWLSWGPAANILSGHSSSSEKNVANPNAADFLTPVAFLSVLSWGRSITFRHATSGAAKWIIQIYVVVQLNTSEKIVLLLDFTCRCTSRSLQWKSAHVT